MVANLKGDSTKEDEAMPEGKWRSIVICAGSPTLTSRSLSRAKSSMRNSFHMISANVRPSDFGELGELRNVKGN